MCTRCVARRNTSVLLSIYVSTVPRCGKWMEKWRPLKIRLRTVIYVHIRYADISKSIQIVSAWPELYIENYASYFNETNTICGCVGGEWISRNLIIWWMRSLQFHGSMCEYMPSHSGNISACVRQMTEFVAHSTMLETVTSSNKMPSIRRSAIVIEMVGYCHRIELAAENINCVRSKWIGSRWHIPALGNKKFQHTFAHILSMRIYARETL